MNLFRCGVLAGVWWSISLTATASPLLMQGADESVSRRTVKQVRAWHEAKQWDEFVPKCVEIMDQAGSDLVVMKDQEYGVGIREWLRGLLQEVPREVLEDYRNEVARHLGVRFQRARAQGDETAVREIAVKFPLSREEAVWKSLRLHVTHDEGVSLPRVSVMKAGGALVSLWSSLLGGVGASLVAEPGGVARVGHQLFVNNGTSLLVLDEATGRLMGNRSREVVYGNEWTGAAILAGVREGARLTGHHTTEFTLASRMEGYTDTSMNGGLLVAQGPLVGESPGYASIMRWLVGVRWEQGMQVKWQTMVLSRPSTMLMEGGMDSVMGEEVFTILDEFVREEEKKIRIALADPEARAAKLAEFGVKTDQEVWAQLEPLRQFLREFGVLRFPPLTVAAEGRVAVAFPQGVVCVVDGVTGFIQWHRRVTEWQEAWEIGLAMDRFGVYVRRSGETGGIEAFDPVSGSRLWEWKEPGQAVGLVGVEDGIVVVTAGTRVKGLDGRIGRERWAWDGREACRGRGAVGHGVAWIPMESRLVGLEIQRGTMVGENRRSGGVGDRLTILGDDLFEVGPTRCIRYRWMPKP